MRRARSSRLPPKERGRHVALKLDGARVARARIAREGAAQDLGRRGGQLADLAELRGDRADGGAQQVVEGVLARVEEVAREAIEQHEPRREDVGAEIDHLAARLLGRHEAGVALDHADLGAAHAPLGLGDAEVGELHLAAVGDQHVARRDVAMDDVLGRAVLGALRVREGQRVEDLVHDVEGRGDVEGTADLRDVLLDDLAQIPPVDVLEREVVLLAGLAEVEHGHDVRVHQARLQAGFIDELVHGLAAAREVRMHALEDEVPDEVLGAVGRREEDLRHAALTDALDQTVAPHLPQLSRGRGSQRGRRRLVRRQELGAAWPPRDRAGRRGRRGSRLRGRRAWPRRLGRDGDDARHRRQLWIRTRGDARARAGDGRRRRLGSRPQRDRAREPERGAERHQPDPGRLRRRGRQRARRREPQQPDALARGPAEPDARAFEGDGISPLVPDERAHEAPRGLGARRGQQLGAVREAEDVARLTRHALQRRLIEELPDDDDRDRARGRRTGGSRGRREARGGGEHRPVRDRQHPRGGARRAGAAHELGRAQVAREPSQRRARTASRGRCPRRRSGCAAAPPNPRSPAGPGRWRGPSPSSTRPRAPRCSPPSSPRARGPPRSSPATDRRARGAVALFRRREIGRRRGRVQALHEPGADHRHRRHEQRNAEDGASSGVSFHTIRTRHHFCSGAEPAREPPSRGSSWFRRP